MLTVFALLGVPVSAQLQSKGSLDTDQRDVLYREQQRGPLDPEERISERLRRGQFAEFVVGREGERRNYVLNDDGTVNVLVRVHDGIDIERAAAHLARYGSLLDKLSDHAWLAVVEPSALVRLAQEKVVRWIDVPPLPFLPESDRTRKLIGVDTVQNFDTVTGRINGVAGRGVQVGIFDWGFDETHSDFAGRVIANDAPADPHGTSLAGLTGGSGVMSDKTDSNGRPNMGSAYQWRGMAPLAELININRLPPLGRAGASPDIHLYYITKFGMDVSNHSYAVSFDGAYDFSNETRDQLIRGDAISGGKRVPPRLHVTSAGNSGAGVNDGGVQTAYFSLTKQVKNALVVGNWDAWFNQIASTSSLGPAHDGRIKPDVVAPGHLLTSAGSCHGSREKNAAPGCVNVKTKVHTFERPRDLYIEDVGGTSQSAAVATGVVALMLEQYVKSYSVILDERPPLPSTLRGVIIHTATDVVGGPWHKTHAEGAVNATPGPDFVTGWGIINAKRAVNTIANRLLHEDSLGRTCDELTYAFHVPENAESLRVTLAWDDVAANVKLALDRPTDPRLVNDLDLVLIAPDGITRHYPWKLDQEIYEAHEGGRELSAEEQTCRVVIRVQRSFIPNLNPKVEEKERHRDEIPATGIPVAVRGPDHLNNVEVVDVVGAPAAGVWHAVVSGFNVRQGPQRFSLIGHRLTFARTGR